VIFSRIQPRSIIVSIRNGAAAIRPGINPLTRTGLLTADFRLARAAPSSAFPLSANQQSMSSRAIWAVSMRHVLPGPAWFGVLLRLITLLK
jgi:hypothetical protein